MWNEQETRDSVDAVCKECEDLTRQLAEAREEIKVLRESKSQAQNEWEQSYADIKTLEELIEIKDDLINGLEVEVLKQRDNIKELNIQIEVCRNRYRTKRLDVLDAKIARLRKALEEIRDYKPDEICFDESSYNKMVVAYRSVAELALELDISEGETNG